MTMGIIIVTPAAAWASTVSLFIVLIADSLETEDNCTYIIYSSPWHVCVLKAKKLASVGIQSPHKHSCELK